jgi:hypothetical protein
LNEQEYQADRGLALVAVPLLLASLGGCASTFDAKVSRFQSQLPAPAGQTFAIVAENPRNQGGLEFSQYASLVAAQLQKVGYVPAASPDNADLIVHFDYGVDQGRDRVRTTGVGPDPFWGRGTAAMAGLWGRRLLRWRRFLWSSRLGLRLVRSVLLGRRLQLGRCGDRLYQRDRPQDRQPRRWQAPVRGQGRGASQSNRLPYLVPNLVEAMFTDFPGHNGETLRISVAPEKKTVKQVK